MKIENQVLLGASGTAHSANTALMSRPTTTMLARPHLSPKLVMYAATPPQMPATTSRSA